MSFEAPDQDIKLPEKETVQGGQDAESATDRSQEDTTRAQEVEGLLTESQEFLDNEERYGETRREAAVGFLKEKHPDLEPGTEQYFEAWSRLVQGITYNQFKSSEYFVEHPEITFDQYQGDRDHLDVYSDFARRVESAKKEAMDQSSFSARVQGEEGWEFITVDMDNLDSLDAVSKERFLTGLRGEKERRIGASKLSILVEKGLIKPDEVGDYLKNNGNIRPDRGVLDVFSPSAIKKLQQDPAWSNRILQEVEADAGKLKSAGKNDPDLAAVYSAQILRADVGSPDVQGRLLKYYIHNEDLKMALTRQIEQSSQHNVPVTGDRFTPKDLGAFAEAGIISHDELMEIAKRNVEWYKSKGVEVNADKSSEDYLRRGNRAHLLGEAVGQTYVYKRLGLISQAELDELLDY